MLRFLYPLQYFWRTTCTLNLFRRKTSSLVSWAKFQHHDHGIKPPEEAAIGSNPTSLYIGSHLKTKFQFSPLWKEWTLLCESNQHMVTGFRWSLASELLHCCKLKCTCRHRSASDFLWGKFSEFLKARSLQGISNRTVRILVTFESVDHSKKKKKEMV